MITPTTANTIGLAAIFTGTTLVGISLVRELITKKNQLSHWSVYLQAPGIALASLGVFGPFFGTALTR